MKNTEEKLLNELKKEGASNKEIEELFSITKSLSKFSNVHLSQDVKNEFLNKLNRNKKRFFPFWKKAFPIPSLTFAILLLFVSTPIVLAQKSLPGEPLYPLKKISENAAVIIRPQVKEDIVVRRSEEVKKLVEKKSEEKLIKETLKEYKKEARTEREARQSRKENKKTEKSEKTEKSLENLKEAREKMEDEDKEEIEETIRELEESKEKIEEKVEDMQERIKGKMDFKEKIRVKIEDD